MDSSHQLRIDTPEQVSLELPLAGVGSRFLAMAVDTLLQLALYATVIGLLVVFPLLRSIAPGGMAAFMPAVILFLFFCIYWGYFAFFEILWNGRTPGKRAARLRVIRDSGRPLDVSAALIRNVLRAVDMLPFFYGVGVICMVANRQSKRIGDLVAGTVVVRDDPAERLDATWMESAAPATALPGGGRLPDAELALIEAFLVRRHDLEWQTRDRHAEQIVARVKDRTGVAPAPGQSAEEFLEAVARATRGTARLR